MARQWSHGLFGCFDDCGTCLVTYFCHCYTAGKNAEAVGDSCLLCGLATFVPLANIFFMAQIRSKIREQKGIDGTFLNDILATCCCPLCMLVQSAQEVKGSPGAMSIARSWSMCGVKKNVAHKGILNQLSQWLNLFLKASRSRYSPSSDSIGVRYQSIVIHLFVTPITLVIFGSFTDYNDSKVLETLKASPNKALYSVKERAMYSLCILIGFHLSCV